MENLFYKWKQLWEGVFHIQDLFSDYMYLVVGEEKAALIDTGMGFPGLRQLVERLTDKPVIVLNTHGHLDHIGGNDEFGCIYLHPDDLVVYAEHGMESYRSGVIRDMARELGVELSEEIMQALVCNRLKRQLVSENPEKLENNVSSVKVRKKPELMALPTQINLGGRGLEVLHTPGHTKGSVCFYDRKNEILFSGDTVCSMGVMLNFPESVPVEGFMQSIDFLREKTGKCEQIYPGHHKVPLADSYFQKYLDCGELVLTHPEQGVAEESACGEFFRLHYEDVSLTYVR